MSRWFRFHADAMRNPKVARLTDSQFRLWVELLSVAAENDGAIPCLEDLKHMLKRRLDHLSRGVDDLLRAGLMDPLGDGYEPHNWNKFQYKSDTSTDRVIKHREKRNVSETPPETDTDTEADSVEAKASTPRRAKASLKFAMADDWMPVPLPATVADMVDQWPDGRLERELHEFRAYWIERREKRPGWDRSWHSRINDIHEKVLRENRNGNQNLQFSNGNGADKRSGLARAIDEGLDHIDRELAALRSGAGA